MVICLQTLSQDTKDVLNDSLRTIHNLTKAMREKFQAAIKWFLKVRFRVLFWTYLFVD